MPTEKTCQYWLEVALHYTETRLSAPQYEECKASLTTTARAEAAEAELTAAKKALKQSKIIGIYDEFHCLADAIEQLTHYVKELESYKDRLEIGKQAAEADRDRWQQDAERLAGAARDLLWKISEAGAHYGSVSLDELRAALAAHDAADGDRSEEETNEP